MSQTFPLDRVIRRTDSSTSPNEDEKKIIIDANTKRILPKEPFIGIGRDIRYFLVSTENEVECEGPTSTIKDVATQRSVNISTRYEASCEQGNEEKAVLALLDEKHPGAVLNNLIDRWIKDFVRNKKNSGIDFIQDYFQLRPELQEHIARKSLEITGLQLDIHLSLDYERNLSPYLIKSGFFPVRVCDYNDELNLKFSTELQIDIDNKISAILNYPKLSSLESILKNHIQRFMLEKVTLHEFCYELNSEIRNSLIQRLNNVLTNKGRRIAFLTLESSSISSLPPETIKLNYDVKCDIKEYPEPITVKHKLLLNLVDVGKYRASHILDIEAWAEARLNKISQSVLFDKRYEDLILDFDENEIKNPMEKEASLIGYKVKQLMAIPNLPPLKLREGFMIEHEGSYVTHDARVEVKLSIVVTGMIRDLRKVAKYLNPTTNIIDEMREVISRETAQLMHIIDPERFYMRFNFTDIENEVPVEEELKSKIAHKLKEEFFVEDVHVIPKILETDLTERFQKLQEDSPYYFDIEIFPLRDGGRREPVTFRVGFEILSVYKDGWYIFQSKKFESKDGEINKIKEVLREDLKSNLDTIPAAILQYGEIQKKYDIEENMLKAAILKIIKTFGLVIDIDIRRLATEAETAEQKKIREFIRTQSETDVAATEMTNKAHLKELQELYKKRADLITAGIEDDDPEMVSVMKRIQNITQKISSYSIEEEGGEQLKKLTSGVAEEDFDFNKYKKISLPIREHPKQLQEGTKKEEEKAQKNKDKE